MKERLQVTKLQHQYIVSKHLLEKSTLINALPVASCSRSISGLAATGNGITCNDLFFIRCKFQTCNNRERLLEILAMINELPLASCKLATTNNTLTISHQWSMVDGQHSLVIGHLPIASCQLPISS